MFSTLLEAPGWPNMAIMQGKNRNTAFVLLFNAMFRVPGGKRVTGRDFARRMSSKIPFSLKKLRLI